MASSKIKGINIKIGADTTGLDTELKKIESAGKKATSELREVNSSLRNNNDSVVLWKQKQELLTTALEESCKKLDFLHEAQEQIKRQFENGEIDGGQYRAFQREIETAQRNVNSFENQLQQANTRLEELTRTTEESTEQIDELGDEMQESGEQAENSANGGYTVLGNVFANLITEGIKLAWNALKNFTADVVATGEEYEAAISNVTAISGAMSEEVEMLQAKAEEMGATTKFTAAESAEAMSYMAMAGWKVNDMISGLDGIMDLSAASGENLASVSDIVTDALTAFGLQASDSAHFADVLAAASSNANTNVAMMGETFKYAAPLAGTLKYSIEDMAVATGLMANSGIKASQAGTTLNSSLSRMAKPTKEMKGYMQELGLVTMRTFDQSADPKAIEKAMKIVEDRTLSAENAQIRLNQAIEKYGENSAQALTATNNLTKAQNSLEEAQEALTDLQNGEIVSIIDKNLLLTDEEGNLKSLRETIDTLRDAFSGLSEVEQAEAASALFGKNSMAGMLSIVNAKTEDYKKLAEAVDNADGTAKGMASTMLDNLQGDKTLLDSAIDGMKIAISKELNPALRELVQWGTQQIPKVQTVIEPLFKGAVNGVKSLINGFEKIKPVLSAVKPLIITIFANEAISLFTTKLLPKALELLGKLPTPLTLISNLITSVAGFPAKFIETIGKVPSVVGNIKGAFQGLWTVISANPLAALTVAATTATLALKSYFDNKEVEKTEMELLIEKHNEELQLLIDKRRAIEDLNDAFYENVDGIQYQTDRTRDLWNELDKLADQYGNVQQKDQARAEYILNELNEALGTEYTMTGNQIDNYKQLSAEIDNVIAKKQAEMMLDAYLSNSTEMTKQRIEARTDYEKYDREYAEKQAELEEAERRFQNYKKYSMNNSDISADDYVAGNFSDNETSTSNGYNLANSVLLLREELQQAKNARAQAKITYEKTSEYFEQLDDLQEAYSLGQYDRMAEIIYAEKDLTSTTLDETATDAEQRLQIYSENLQKTLSDFELAVKDMRQKSVDEMEQKLSDTMQYGLIAGKTPKEIWANFVKEDDFYKLQANGLDISPLITSLVESGATPAEIFGNDWKEIFRTQLANGGDMSSMIEWLNNSGYYASISSVFGNDNDFISYIKNQQKNGQDIEYLLEWGAKSGLAESEEFVKIFKSNVAKNLEKGWDVGNLLEIGNNAGISCAEEFAKGYGKQMQTLKDNGVDLTEFIQQAEANNKTAAEVLGENFKSELMEYLKISRESAIETIKENYLPQILKQDTLSERLIKGFANGKNISELVKQSEKQGLKVGDVFGDNYTDVIQQQIDNGYSIDELLEWGKESALSTADMFGDKYTPEVQYFIDKGFSVDSLLNWARNAGISAGKLFGENFQSIADNYINDHQEKIEYIRHEIVDSSYYGNFFFGKTRFMADGGFLHNGQAIVAEAGPELLEVMNGGVKVTPLTRSSQNTPVSDGGQKIFYSSYTINATIANGYDVSKLAEELETERRRIENGRGM
ncbi:MAG: phage tail tape measure protein [Ruminococcus sp.]|nr:phage tail tape measure protein [Ruminococcus sp.]